MDKYEREDKVKKMLNDAGAEKVGEVYVNLINRTRKDIKEKVDSDISLSDLKAFLKDYFNLSDLD